MTVRPDPGEGRRLYGLDPDGYERGRPDYPPAVYERLRTTCGLGPGVRVVEIGPGTGLVTRRLVEAGASVTAVEPSETMADYLRRRMAGMDVDVVVSPFESAPLPTGGFDLAVAATSFHWVAQPAGMEKLRQVVRPGGSVAIWWMLFDDPSAPDALTRRVEELVGPAPGTQDTSTPFQFDIEERTRDLLDAGFVNVRDHLLRCRYEMDADAARALYASMAVVIRQLPEMQQRLLGLVTDFVRAEPRGMLHREFPVALYTAEAPSQ